MVLTILKSEIARLKREESGVALMMTLSVFLLLFVLCAGVYSIGETVRQKVELQNACDSAAYSVALVQADGLSRMAMVNRALSWTYVQLTNMQIDYVTYKWLQLVRKRFGDDRSNCLGHNSGSRYRSHGNRRCGESSLKSPGTGWLCGIAGKGMDLVRLNGRSDEIPISAIDEAISKCSYMEDYYVAITNLKQTIRTYNDTLTVISRNMHLSMAQTASAVLAQNLPRDEKGKIDTSQAADFVFFQDVPFPMAGNESDPNSVFFSPYDITELDEFGNPVGAGYFSPLLNTELCERIFLTMADGEVHDTLAGYFGPSGDDARIAGGLDQWWIRCGTNVIARCGKCETFCDTQVVRPYEDPNAYRQFGICRGYKNANREVYGSPLNSYRDHHRSIERDADSDPSCLNQHSRCPEQCHAIPDSVGLMAEYEWCAGQYHYECWHYHYWKFKLHLHRLRSSFVSQCNHICPIAAGSHARSEYKSCIAKNKKLKTINFVNGNELNVAWPPIEYYPGDIDPHWLVTLPTVQYSVMLHPNGFARIYGDDKDLVNKYPEAYIGTPAMPWLLNDSFYGKDGATVVGLARKQRNPFSRILNAVAGAVSQGYDNTGEKGIYSAFNPVTNGYLVAFSAARAAHRFHPSTSAIAWTKSHRDAPDLAERPGVGEYETRYDAVCDDIRYDGNGNNVHRFNVRCNDDNLLEMRVGCVCNDVDNGARFARCWNLCETDWDATLLPLRYAWAGVQMGCDWFDSFLHDNGEVNSVPWEDVGRDGNYGLTPFEYSVATSSSWARFFDSAGNQVEVDADGEVKRQFLVTDNVLGMKAPMNPRAIYSRRIGAPYGGFTVNEASRGNTGSLNPSQLHLIRIL